MRNIAVQLNKTTGQLECCLIDFGSACQARNHDDDEPQPALRMTDKYLSPALRRSTTAPFQPEHDMHALILVAADAQQPGHCSTRTELDTRVASSLSMFTGMAAGAGHDGTALLAALQTISRQGQSYHVSLRL